jgi:hypothetical protein
MRSVYFCRMRSASAFRFSKGCSSLNVDFMLMSQTWSRSSGRENRGLALRNETHERQALDVERTDGDVVGVAVVLCVERRWLMC